MGKGIRKILSDTFKAEEAISQYAVVVYGNSAGGVKLPSAQDEGSIAGVAQDDASASGDSLEVMQIGKGYVNMFSTASVGALLSIKNTIGEVYENTAIASGDGFVGTVEEAATASGDQVIAYINVGTFIA